MKLAVSLPWSQQTGNGPYTQPDESIPHPHIYFFKIYFHLHLCSPNGVFRSHFSTTTLSAYKFITLMRATCPAYIVLFDSITLIFFCVRKTQERLGIGTWRYNMQIGLPPFPVKTRDQNPFKILCSYWETFLTITIKMNLRNMFYIVWGALVE